jgi:hypothetical protein
MSLDPIATPGWRPMLLGYMRAAVVGTAAAQRRERAELEAFVAREDFTLGPVFVDGGDTPGAFHALLDELSRNDTVRGVLIPDLRHLSSEEQLVLSRHENGSRTPVLTVRFAPLAGGPGAESPVCSGPATLFKRARARSQPLAERG